MRPSLGLEFEQPPDRIRPARALPRRFRSHRPQLPELTVIYWRDIPAQVTAVDGTAAARAQLADRFQLAIDDAAMQAGLVGSEEYLAEWRREIRACSADLQSEVDEEAARLEAAFTPEKLGRLVDSGGRREGT